ncbi:hypothetical protein SNEBB_008844 [Seison nebaliae]|nr:hypothetical protein SNEBB_008844 [Seison nebaliae]
MSTNEKRKEITPEEMSLEDECITSALCKEFSKIEIEKKEKKVTSSDILNDERSPLYSVGTFREFNLSPDLIKALYNMQFTKPTRIQQIILGHLLNKKRTNLLAQSQSGTGKTATFILAALKIIDLTVTDPQVLIICPTFELALQVGNVASKLSIHLKSLAIAHAIQRNSFEKFVYNKGEQLIIGTPGTIENWIKLGYFEPAQLRMLILDEADVMLSQRGHQEFTMNLKKRINSDICQILLFSATYTAEVLEYAKKIIPNTTVIELPKEKQVLDNIVQYFVRCVDDDEKFRVIFLIFCNVTIGQTITFCHRRSIAKNLAEKVRRMGCSVSLLSADLRIEERKKVIDSFRKGDIRFLISTNVVARGIDVEQVNLVLNYDLPQVEGLIDLETYVHRIGRTGRFGRRGIAINFCKTEREVHMLDEIKSNFTVEIKELKLDSDHIREELDHY